MSASPTKATAAISLAEQARTTSVLTLKLVAERAARESERRKSGTLGQQLAQHRCVAQLELFGGGQQRDRAPLNGVAQLVERLALWLQLGQIAAAEFRELLRVVPIPLAQRVAGREVFDPDVELERGLG